MNDCWIDVWSIRFDRQIIDRIRCCPTLGSILFAQYLFYCLVWGILILSDYLIPSWFPINLYTNSIPILIQFRLESSSIQFLFILFELNAILFEFNLLLLSARIDGNYTKDASKNHDSCPIWSYFALSSHSDRIPDTRFSNLVWFDLKLERNNFCSFCFDLSQV